MSTTLAINLWPVSTTTGNNPCHEFLVIASVADTGDKFLTGVNNTSELLSPVTMTPAVIYCRWQEQGRQGNKSVISPAADSDTAAKGLIGTSMKSCIHRHPTHPDQRPLRPPKLNIVLKLWSSFGGLRGLLSRCAGCLWMQLFMAVQMKPLAVAENAAKF